MNNVTPRCSNEKPSRLTQLAPQPVVPRPERRLLERLGTFVGARLNARADADAALLGWHIRTTHGGLGRSYRDSRFIPAVNPVLDPVDQPERAFR